MIELDAPLAAVLAASPPTVLLEGERKEEGEGEGEEGCQCHAGRGNPRFVPRRMCLLAHC